MVFLPPSSVPKLPFHPPDDVHALDFLFDEQYGRDLDSSLPLFTCGLSGTSWSLFEYKAMVEDAAKGLAQITSWLPGGGCEWSKVACIYSPNTIDYVAATWAVLRLGGVCAPLNAASTLSELIAFLKLSGASCIFTTITHLATAEQAAKKCRIPSHMIFILQLPASVCGDIEVAEGFASFDELVKVGRSSNRYLEPNIFEKGQGARQAAYLCSSSGTSGQPKGVMISHQNVISTVLQTYTFDRPNRAGLARQKGVTEYRETALGLLPFSHSYGLMVIATLSAYRGDTVVVLPKFELRTLLSAIESYKITSLYMVPPLVISLRNNKVVCDEFDLESVDSLITAAAPLGSEIAAEVRSFWPQWAFRQLYGITEATALVASTYAHDAVLGSSGSLLPGIEARLLSPDGSEITQYDQPGELVVRSPALVMGYLNRDEATKETFRDGWLHTGDEVVIRKSPSGFEHIWITDRLKEMIKVKGLQVAPAELEAHILSHPAVADCAVIPVPHERSGEVPKAFVVKAAGYREADAQYPQLIESIKDHVRRSKARYKWLEGGVQLVDAIPKLPSGKILRRVLKHREREGLHAMDASTSELSSLDKREHGHIELWSLVMWAVRWFGRLAVRTKPDLPVIRGDLG